MLELLSAAAPVVAAPSAWPVPVEQKVPKRQTVLSDMGGGVVREHGEWDKVGSAALASTPGSW